MGFYNERIYNWIAESCVYINRARFDFILNIKSNFTLSIFISKRICQWPKRLRYNFWHWARALVALFI